MLEHIQPWGKAVKKILIDKDMTMKDLAAAVGFTTEHVSAVVNGRVMVEGTKSKILALLGLSDKVA